MYIVVVWVNRPPSLESFHVSASFPSFQRSLKNKYQNSSVSHLQIFERQQKVPNHTFSLDYNTMFESNQKCPKLQHQIILFCKLKRVFPCSCWAFKLIPKVNNIKMSFFANQMELFQSHVEHKNWYFFILEKIARNR